jgi:hypothetical protein
MMMVMGTGAPAAHCAGTNKNETEDETILPRSPDVDASLWPSGTVYSSPMDLSVAQIKDLLQHENTVRLCDATMTEYEALRHAGDSEWINVVERVQRRVCEHFGLSEYVGVNAMRCAETLPQMTASDVADVIEISHYRRFNRCKDGTLQVGDPAPSLALFRYTGGGVARSAPVPCTFPCPSAFDLVPPSPLLVVAASYS